MHLIKNGKLPQHLIIVLKIMLHDEREIAHDTYELIT
jgi:hypothetical protein